MADIEYRRGEYRISTDKAKLAHELYRRYGGFETLQHPEAWMTRA